MLGRTYANMAGACWFLKRPQEGIDYLKKAITYYERTDHKTNAADGYNNLGINLILIGQWDRAQDALEGLCRWPRKLMNAAIKCR